MTRTRWLIVAFWLFVAVMLVIQFQQENARLNQDARDNPKDGHYFFTPPLTNSAPPTIAPPVLAPDIRQTAFVVHPNTPGFGSFTCDVTVTNQGLRPAKAVQVHVRPFRGVMSGNDGLGHVKYRAVPENDPLSQYGDWLAFPDLKPGESSTQSAVFLNHPNVNPGHNPNPEITFEPAKSNPP
jgi:hypothetical protein